MIRRSDETGERHENLRSTLYCMYCTVQCKYSVIVLPVLRTVLCTVLTVRSIACTVLFGTVIRGEPGGKRRGRWKKATASAKCNWGVRSMGYDVTANASSKYVYAKAKKDRRRCGAGPEQDAAESPPLHPR